jgi:hypothetical protein
VAIELAVKLSEPIVVRDILASSHDVLRDILATDDVPALTTATRSGDLAARQDYVFVGIGDDDRALVAMLTIDHGGAEFGEWEGLWLNLDINPCRTELSLLLAASLAVAVARQARSRVHDEAKLFGASVQGADELVASIGHAQCEGSLEARAADVCRRVGFSFAT